MRETKYFLTEEFIAKLLSICNQRPAAAYYDVKSQRLTINDMELFAKSVQQIDRRSLTTFLKRVKTIGFILVETQNVTIYQWTRKTKFVLNKELEKANRLVFKAIQKRKEVMDDMASRREHVSGMLQKMIFEVLVLNGQEGEKWVKKVEGVIEEVQRTIKSIAAETVEGIDELEKIAEQEIFIYRTILPGSNDRL